MQSCFMGLELKGEQMEAVPVWFGTSFTLSVTQQRKQMRHDVDKEGYLHY